MKDKNTIQNAAVLLVILLMLPASALATAQQPDVLNYKGKTYSLFSNPLEDYYENRKDRPRFVVEPGVMSTGNWRGYVATWTVEDGVLYLVKIDAWLCRNFEKANCTRVELPKLFGNKYLDGRVKADWYTGVLRVPDGKQLQYVHMGYGSVYEREIILQVEAGKIVGESIIDNTKRVLPSEMELQRQELEKMKPKPKSSPGV